jgi:glycopeptide antibiotics resistance protein
MGRRCYWVWFGVLLATELCIALWVHDAWLRPYGGDVLACVLVYVLIRASTSLRRREALVVAYATALAVELAQWAQLLERFGLAHHTWLRVAAGSVGDVGDLAAYTLGAALAALVEAIAGHAPTKRGRPARHTGE